MASIPFAIYQACCIHGNLKKDERERSHSEGFVKAPNFSVSTLGFSVSSLCNNSIGRNAPAYRGGNRSLSFHFQFPFLLTCFNSSSERWHIFRKSYVLRYRQTGMQLTFEVKPMKSGSK